MFEERRSSNKSLTAFAVFGVVGVVALVGVIAHQAGQASIEPQSLLGVSNSNEYEHLFRSWMSHYNRKYDNFGEYLNRFNVFVNNARMIEHHNTNGNDYSLSINQFADLTTAEFKELFHGLDTSRSNTNYVSLPTNDLPDSMDWTENNAVTPVKNQGECGSCWSFSTTGALEGLHAIRKGTLESFSEQQLVDCSTSYGNMGCHGGLMDNAFKYVEKFGIELESEYPYQGVQGSCEYDPSKVAFKISGYHDVPAQNNLQLKAAVAQQPVSVAIQANQHAFQFYSGGVLTGSCGTELDHGVLTVGYGIDGDVKFWKVKNSWGPDWGENGFVRIERREDTSPGKCGIALGASYPTVETA